MLLSRAKPASGTAAVKDGARSSSGNKANKIPDLEEFLKQRDYTGAIALLEYNKKTGKGTNMDDMWIAYCYFHLGEFTMAMDTYEQIIKNGSSTESKGASGDSLDDVWLYKACSLFFSAMYKEAEDCMAKIGTKTPLRNRLEFHLAHKIGDEKTLMQHHQNLKDVLQDQLCLASIHYLRSHYQEAIDIYKKILLEHRDFLALNVYVALCYYKLDYYDVSQEVLAIYLQNYPDSAIAINLKACNYYRLFNGKAAETEIRGLIDSASSSFTFAKDLIRHNLVVFRGGEGALQVFPPLIDILPEARLNLVIYYLRNDEIQEAYDLLKELEPSVPHEYILKGVVNAAMGQDQGSRDNLKVAQQFFQVVGGSASECDTIPGRQCMASCFFIMKQFDDVLLYLSSIKSYFYNDDTFNFNYAQAKCATGNFREAEETFLLIQSDRIKNDFVYISWLVKCYIVNKKPEEAWPLYQKVSEGSNTSNSFTLLSLIANDCYKMGQFLHSAKAFSLLEKMDPNPEHFEGKRGACCGAFQMVLAGREPASASETISEVLRLLRTSSHPQAEQIITAIRNWQKNQTRSN